MSIESKKLTEINGLKTGVVCVARPGSSGSGTTEKYFTKNEIFASKMFSVDNHHIYFTSCTPTLLEGYIVFGINRFGSIENPIEVGNFSLDLANPIFSTGFKSLCYDMQMELWMRLE